MPLLPGLSAARRYFFRPDRTGDGHLSYYLSGMPLRMLRHHLLTDAFFVSFPNCGRTWLRTMIGRALIRQFELDRDDFLNTRQLTRAVEGFSTLWPRHEDSPQLKTPGELHRSFPEFGDKKILFQVRAPKDVMVSFYFQESKRNERFDGSLSEFLERDRGGLRTLLTYYNIWEENRDAFGNFKRVCYEELHEDAGAVLSEVLSFLGPHLVFSEEVIEEAVEFASFENMRRRERTEGLDSAGLSVDDRTDVEDEESFKTRKGKKGGYEDYLDPDEVENVDRIIREHLHPNYPYPI